MAEAAYHQSAFLGGEWGPLSQGRSDLPAYHQAMNVCINGIIAEEGAWTRRSGFQWLAPTHLRNPAKLIPYVSSYSSGPISYVMELTDLSLRFYTDTAIIFSNTQSAVTASSFAAGALDVTVASATGFAIGDDVQLWSPPTLDPAKIGPFRGRVMRIMNVAALVITLKDDTGSSFTGISSTADDLVTCVLYQIKRIATSWTGTDVLQALRAVQTGTGAIILSSTVAPTTVAISAAQDVSLATTVFVDGPYMDQQGTFTTPETGTVNAYTGSITFTPATSTFAAADVGRHIRLYQQPPAFNIATTYTYGQVVTYRDEWWTFIYSSGLAGVIPGTVYTVAGDQKQVWAPAVDQGIWAWGIITAQASSSATVSLQTDLISANGSTISIWRLGLFKSGQYPTCGLYHEGRLLLGGALPNRWDASVSNAPLVFSPTEPNGQVNDNNAISEVFNANDVSSILWMVSDHQGVLMGTPNGEWLVQASTLNDPLTPTSVQAHRVTQYMCAPVEPRRPGIALIFVQRYGRRLIEYIADSFSGRFSGRHINEFAKHLSESGIAEIVYQEETIPVVWTRFNDGTLAGCTYRRTSRFSTEAPVFEAWHRQVLGGNYNGDQERMVFSMCVISATDGLSDMLYVSSSDTDGENYFVEVLRPMFEEA